MPYVLTTGETALARLGTKFPDGMIIGARGSHGLLARDSEFNRWFQNVYTDRFSMAPTYPSYHAAQSLLGLKAAWEKAQAKKGGARPNTDEVIAAFEGLEFPTPSTTIRLAIGKGHQGISDIAYGTNRFNKAEGRPEIVDVVRYPAECVNPPPDVDSQAWLEGGMKGAKCN
jgi:branched-chain amino acid transport system substrate-binding protein